MLPPVETNHSQITPRRPGRSDVSVTYRHSESVRHLTGVDLRTDAAPSISRRDLLTGAAALGATTVCGPEVLAAGTPKPVWDHETDVVCVGSGVAGLGAAVAAVERNAAVIVLEKMPLTGGTTSKSGGAIWIPNNHLLRDIGLIDPRDDCLRYMARLSYPQVYNSTSPTLGLQQRDYNLLEAFYDNGYKVVDRLESLGVAHFELFKMYFVNKLAPDYSDSLPEDKTPKGRCIYAVDTNIRPGPGGSAFDVATVIGPGALLIQKMETWLKTRKVPFLLEHRVSRVIKEENRVVGVEAKVGDRLVRIKARRGVVFGSGGYAHNRELLSLHQPALMGACAKLSSTGDFIPIAANAGAQMGALNTAWLMEVVLDEALENPAIGLGVFLLPGDSMFVVNKYGMRIVNEKRGYNDRTKVHFDYDAAKDEFPNQYLFMVFDERTLDSFAGSTPLPVDRREVSYLIEGATLDELAAAIQARVDGLRPRITNLQLAHDFATTLGLTAKRFNELAQNGKDVDFGRGASDFEQDFHLFSSNARAGARFPKNSLPNNTMHPLTERGPYYAIILAAGALDTNGGPMIDSSSRVLDWGANPIPGLYGAGNCIASPTRAGYYGGGGTIGPALTFGYLAGVGAASGIHDGVT